MAVEALEDLWFTRPISAKGGDESQSSDLVSKNGVAQLAAVIMSVTGGSTGQVKDRPPPVDDVLRLVCSSR